MDRRAVRGHAASEHGGDERDGGAAAAVSSGKLLKARRHRGRQQQQQQVQTCKTNLGSEIQPRIAPRPPFFGRLARHEGLFTVPSQLPSPGCTP